MGGTVTQTTADPQTVCVLLQHPEPCLCLVAQSCLTLCDPKDCSAPGGFSTQEYWSGSPCPSPGDLPNPRIKPRSPASQADALPSEPTGKPCLQQCFYLATMFLPGSARSPGEGKGYPLQYAGLENSMDCTIHGVTKTRTRLSAFHFLLPWRLRQ